MKKILILSMPTGGGHHQAAKAMEAFFEAYDDVVCNVLDIAKNVNSALAEAVSKGYILTTMATPKLYGSLYDMFDLRENLSNETSQTMKFLSKVFRKKLSAYVNQFQPDVIISTHPFVTITLNRIYKKKPMTAKLISICTDFTLHPTWEQVKSDYYITASELLNYQCMKKWGTTERVLPLGIPIHPKFSGRKLKAEAKKQLGLSEKFTILVMMGSMGYGTHTEDVLKQLDTLKEEIQILVVCGNNKRLKRRADALKGKLRKTVITYGFVHNIDELMDACDCIITKPGGLSTSEALAKRLPILILNPIPGQEDRNKEFMLNNGIAISISDSYSADEAIYQLIHFPYKMEQMIQNTAQFAKPNAAKDLGELALKLCEDKK